MGKLIVYIMILSITLGAYYFAELIPGTTTAFLLDKVIHPQNIKTTDFFSLAVEGLTALATGATTIVIGLYLSKQVDVCIKAGLAVAILFTIGWDLIRIFNQLAQLHIALATLLISPLIIGYVFTIIEWISGHD